MNLIAWAGYAEDGSNDPSVDWVTGFEKKTGCQVNTKTAASSDEMVSLMKTGQYDAVSASGDAALRLIAAGDAAPVTTQLVPNYKDVFAGLKDQPWNTVKGVSYDSPIYIADAALYLMKTRPALGITNPYALDQKQFDASVGLVKKQNASSGEYWSDYLKEVLAFKSGDSVIGTSRQVILNTAQAEKIPVEAVLPKEGATGWSDTWMLSAKAKHPNCAYQWMDWIISPKVTAQVAEYFGEAPSNVKSCYVTADKNHCATFHAADEAYWKQVHFWTTPIAQCVDGRTDTPCVPYAKWVQAWTGIKG